MSLRSSIPHWFSTDEVISILGLKPNHLTEITRKKGKRPPLITPDRKAESRGAGQKDFYSWKNLMCLALIEELVAMEISRKWIQGLLFGIESLNIHTGEWYGYGDNSGSTLPLGTDPFYSSEEPKESQNCYWILESYGSFFRCINKYDPGIHCISAVTKILRFKDFKFEGVSKQDLTRDEAQLLKRARPAISIQINSKAIYEKVIRKLSGPGGG